MVPLQASSLSLPGLAPGRAAPPTASPPSSPRSAFFYIPCYCPSCYLLGPTTKIVLGPLTTRLFIVQHCRPHLNLLAHINGNLFKLWRVSVCLSSKDNLVWGGTLSLTCDLRQNSQTSQSLSFHFCTCLYTCTPCLEQLKAVLRQTMPTARDRVGSRQEQSKSLSPLLFSPLRDMATVRAQPWRLGSSVLAQASR